MGMAIRIACKTFSCSDAVLSKPCHRELSTNARVLGIWRYQILDDDTHCTSSDEIGLRRPIPSSCMQFVVDRLMHARNGCPQQRAISKPVRGDVTDHVRT